MKILFLFGIISILSILISCEVETLGNTENKAQFIIDHSIEQHGGRAYQDMSIEYQFRDKKYSISNENGEYTYTRSFKKDDQQIKDQLKNNGDFVAEERIYSTQKNRPVGMMVHQYQQFNNKNLK